MIREGMFGPIQVRDTFISRQVVLNGQVQGGAFLEPPAKFVDDELPDDAPGPVAEAAYALGWLLAGVHNQTRSGIMIGLGSGAGAIQMLYNFPGIDLTIVEIDPVMVQMAINAFPLLEWYMNKGQLNIVVEDATTYLKEHFDKWDFGCADGYTGGNCLVEDYMPLLCDRCDHVYVNAIDSLGGKSLRGTLKILEECDQPVTDLFKATSLTSPNAIFAARSNWIVTSQAIDWQKAEEFVPFEGGVTYSFRLVQHGWDHFLASSLSAVT
jgi:hypothetical protein